MILVHKATQLPALIGETLTDFRGDTSILMSMQEPHNPSSTGRVYVRRVGLRDQASYFPSVFYLEWAGRTDR